MVLWLLAAFLQMTFLPGYIMTSLFSTKLGWNGNIIEAGLFSFINSIIINYLLSMLLIAIHAFIHPVLVVIFIVECIIVLYLHFRGHYIWKYSIEKTMWAKGISKVDKHCLYFFVVVVVAVVSVIWFIILLVNNIGTIFMDNDAVGSYNSWAISLTQGKIPSTAYYPLLIVSNWAVGYVLAGSTLEFAAKAMMPLFLAFILLVLVNLYLKERRMAYLLAIPCVCFITAKMAYFYICEGSMDYAVSFYTIAGIYCLIRAGQEKEKDNFLMYMLMAAIVAISIGITKQAGLLLAPLLVLFAVCNGLLKRISKKHIIYFLLAFLFITLSFYIWSFIGVQTGTNSSYVGWLVGGIHAGRSWIQRIFFSVWTIYSIWYMLAPLMVIPVLASLMDPKWRWVNITVFFPYTVVWMLGFSYDTRNWTVGMVLWGIAIAFGIEYIIEAWRKKNAERKIAIGFVTAIVLCTGVILYRVPTARLENIQIDQQKKFVDAELNEAIYTYFDEHEMDGKILSYMSHVAYLPGMEDNCIFAGLDYANDDEFDAYYKKITDKEVGYIVFPDIDGGRYTECPRIKEDLERRIAEGTITIIWKDGEKMFASVKN